MHCADRTFAERAADFILDLAYEDLDETLVDLSRRAIGDFVGVAIAGSLEPVARNVLEWARQRSSGTSASLFAGPDRLDVENAALCNGVAGHALDFDDTSWTTIGHPTTVVAPAAIAVAEATGASGRDVIRAYVAGVEVAHRLAAVMMPAASAAGWHTTGIFYSLGAAAAACSLLRPPPGIVVNAFGLSLSKSAGIRSNFGTQSKPYHAGMAARSGLEAVSLAMLGLSASPRAAEGQDGFIQCFSGTDGGNAIRGLAPFGQPFDLTKNGLAFKKYPCCSGAHPAVDLVLDLVRAHRIEPGDIDRIEVGVSLLAEKELVCHLPRSAVEARFSMEFALAAAILRGELGLEEFSDRTVRDPAIVEMMHRVRIELDPELAALGFIGTAPVRMRLHLKDGSVIQGRRDLAHGNPERPFGPEDFERKFLQCATGHLSFSAAKELFERLAELDRQLDLDGIMRAAAGQSSPHEARTTELGIAPCS